MRVEIWSDVVCPWCYIGKRRFEAALSRFEHADRVEVVWRSFELDPSAPPPPPDGGDVVAHLAAKYGVERDQAAAMVDRMTEVAAGEGLEFRLDIARRGPTFDAHRLLHLAAERGRQGELKEALLSAYLHEGLDVSDHGVLADLAAGAGLDRDEAVEVLADGHFADQVRVEEELGRHLGISGVPFFVLDGRYGVSGAQDPEVLLQALRRAWGDRPAVEVLAPADGAAICGPDGCDVPGRVPPAG